MTYFRARLIAICADDSPASQFQRFVIEGDVKLSGRCNKRNLLPERL
jgi:hypothetical protein